MSILFELLAIAFLGVIAVWLGVRGRFIDDHPWCAKCRYDLFGIDDSSNCPECGADLDAPKAVRVGRRRHVPLAIAAGLLILLVSGAAITVIATRIDWTPHKPVWFLLSQTNAAGPAQDAALAELLRRLDDRELSRRQINRVADAALAAQADTATPWNATWGDFIETAWLSGQLDGDRVEIYCRRAFDEGFMIEVRRRVRAGGPIPARFWPTGRARLGSSPPRAREEIAAEVILDLFGPRAPQEVARRFIGRRNIGAHTMRLDLDLEPGHHTIEFVARIGIHEGPLVHHLQTPPHLFAWDLVIPVEIEVVAPHEPIVERVADPAVADGIRGSIQTPQPMGISRPMRISIFNPPAAVSFRVYARHAEREEQIATIVCAAGSASAGHVQVNPRFLFPEAKSITLIFRTDPTLAERTGDILEVWDGEIVIENVPLVAPDDGE